MGDAADAGLRRLAIFGKRTYPEVPADALTFAGPDSVVCIDKFFQKDPFAASGAGGPNAPVAGSTYTFGGSTSGASDPRRELQERLTRLSTRDFVAALREVAAK